MHVYAVNNNKRDWVVRVLAIMDVSVFFILGYFSVNEKVLGLLGIDSNNSMYVFLESAITALIPISFFGIANYLYDWYIWRWPLLKKWHGLPNLNGAWEGYVKSPLKKTETGEEIKIIISVKIEQTWNRIKISTKSNSKANSESAMIEITEQGDIYLRYAFTTKREGQLPYQGYNRLHFCEREYTLQGEYFTAKNIDGEPGKGSKGIFYIKRI